jgi:diguanylate cyclase (GGDEF)-like protein
MVGAVGDAAQAPARTGAGDHSKRILAHQARILDLIARGVRVEQTLEAIVSVADSELPGVHCTVLAAVGKRPMRHLVAGGLDPEWIDAVESAGTGPIGTILTAPIGRLTVIDLAADRDWGESAAPLVERGWRAAWVVPMLSLAEDRMLGAVVAYTSAAEPPDEPTEELLATLTRLASLAIGRGRLQERLGVQALRDDLTGLANRALFHDRITQAMARAARSDRTVAVVVVDLRHLGAVNQEYGRAAADDVLVEVARRLERSTRTGETVARLEGGDFGILCEDLVPERARAAALACATRAREAVRVPVTLRAASRVLLDAEIGIALAGSRDITADELLRDGDAAAHAAKRSRAGVPVVADGAAVASTRYSVVAALQEALEREQLQVAYQPIVDLRSGRCIAAEALLRWQHPERGLVPPAEFIGPAEDSGLILPIGRAVLATVLRDIESLSLPAGFAMSVNLSARQLRGEFVDDLAALLASSRVPPGSLCLEITESVLLDDVARSTDLLAAIRALGVGLAIDDFGTGYSSLGYLRRLPVGSVKIDRSFVAGLEEHVEDVAIVHHVVSLAHSLGLRVVAEGVETPNQFARLRELGCDAGQGYLFAAPERRPGVDERLTARYREARDRTGGAQFTGS